MNLDVASVHALLPYIPIDRRLAMASRVPLPDSTYGAALFADVSGFTPLTRLLVRELGRKLGAEALLTYLNPIYDSLITTLHHYRGSVISFVGDGITCWFAGELASQRALTCGLAMQEAMQPFITQYTPQGTAVTFSIKVAIAAGPARRFIVGNPDIRQWDVIAGATLAKIAAANEHAQAEEVVVGRDVLTQVGETAKVIAWRGETPSAELTDWAVVTAFTTPCQPDPWPTLDSDLPSLTQVRAWVLPEVWEQLQSGKRYLGDLRPVTPMMIRFGGLDFDHDPDVGHKLDAFVRWVQATVHQHGGIVSQLSIGDKGAFIYAPFGAPLAHEDDTQRALRTALALRTPPPDLDWLPPLQIGLSRGDVWTGSVGSTTRHTYTAMGREVNLAARLMMQAAGVRPTGARQIFVSQRVQRERGFRYNFVGNIVYKGFAAPIPTYELLEEADVGERFFTTRLVGRAEEQTQLHTFTQSVLDRQAIGMVVIYGEAGSGKSHLAYTLREALGGRVTWLMGQSDPILQQAFNPFIYFLKTICEQTLAASVDAANLGEENKTRFQHYLDELLAALPDSSVGQRVQAELRRTYSFLGALLGLRWPDSLYEQLDAEGRYKNTQIALSTLLQAECLCRPVVLALEDGQWLDTASRDMLTILTRQAAQYPLLILITSRYRDDGTCPNYPIAPGTSTLTLDLTALSSDGVRDMALDILGHPIDDNVHQLLLEKTSANPFFVQQILYYLQERSRLRTVVTPDGPVVTVTDEAFALPPSLDSLLIARLDRLAQSVKEVVQTAAVLGREFEVRLLSEMLQHDLSAELSAAEQEQIWVLLNELSYIFRHALLRDAAYDMQLRARLRDLHYLAAVTGESLYAPQLPAYYDTLAYHYETAYLLGQTTAAEKARYYLQQAGEQAAANFENDLAIDYFSRALAHTPTDGDTTSSGLLNERLEIYLQRGAVLELTGQFAATESDYRAALALAQHHKDEARVQFALGELCRRRGDYTTALEWLAQARAGYAALGNLRGLAQVLVETGVVFIRMGEYALAPAPLQEGLDLAREADDMLGTATALNWLGGVAYYEDDYTAARALYEESLALRRELGDKRGIAASLHNLGLVASELGDHTAARALCEESLMLKREMGDKWGIANSLGNLGLVAFEHNDYVAARALQEESLALYREMDNKQGIAYALGNLGNVAIAQADYAAARTMLAESLVLRVESGDQLDIAYNLASLVELAAASCLMKRAAKLAAAVRSLLADIDATLDPTDGSRLDKAIATVRETLGETAFQAAWAEGKQMSLDTAIEYALVNV